MSEVDYQALRQASEHNLSRVPEERSYAAHIVVLSGEISGGGAVSEINYQASIAAGIRIKGEEHGNKTRR